MSRPIPLVLWSALKKQNLYAFRLLLDVVKRKGNDIVHRRWMVEGCAL